MKIPKYVIVALVITAIIGSVAPSMAAPANTPAGSFVNSGDVPTGSKLVVDVTYKVINDEDSGNVGYWALEDYNRQLQVWQVPDGSFYAVGKYNGKWQTFEKALSPGTGAVQSKDASGTMQGGYVATFTGTLNLDPALQLKGNIGTFDFGGTKADVLLGTYGAGQTGPTTPTSVLSIYFPGYSGFTYGNWGWTYNYKSQSWDNFASAITGDIVV